MVYAFIIGPVAITVRYWEEPAPNYQIEAGARVEVRRVVPAVGQRDRPGAAGWRVEPVSDGGLWRSDLLEVITRPDHEPRHHHHPEFRDGDVGRRVFDPALTADPVGWTMGRLADLSELLTMVGADDLAGRIDERQLHRALPGIRAAVDECMAQVNRAVAAV